MNYILFYTEGCTPKTKKFSTLKAAEAFVSRFLKKHSDNTLDNWADVIIEGSIVRTYEGWYGDEVNSTTNTGK